MGGEREGKGNEEEEMKDYVRKGKGSWVGYLHRVPDKGECEKGFRVRYLQRKKVKEGKI